MHNLYYLGLGFRKQVDWRVVAETNHLMVINGGKEAVSGHIGSWLTEKFGT